MMSFIPFIEIKINQHFFLKTDKTFENIILNKLKYSITDDTWKKKTIYYELCAE